MSGKKFFKISCYFSSCCFSILFSQQNSRYSRCHSCIHSRNFCGKWRLKSMGNLKKRWTDWKINVSSINLIFSRYGLINWSLVTAESAIFFVLEKLKFIVILLLTLFQVFIMVSFLSSVTGSWCTHWAEASLPR